MRGFPNRMMYPDFKMRYACLGQAEVSSSSDNKVAVYALMDKIEFDREAIGLVIPWSSSELVPLLVLKKNVMNWSSNGSDLFKEKFSRESVLESM